MIMQQREFTIEVSDFITNELTDLGITFSTFNIRDGAIFDITVKSKLLGVIFVIESNDIDVYYEKLSPL